MEKENPIYNALATAYAFAVLPLGAAYVLYEAIKGPKTEGHCLEYDLMKRMEKEGKLSKLI